MRENNLNSQVVSGVSGSPFWDYKGKWCSSLGGHRSHLESWGLRFTQGCWGFIGVGVTWESGFLKLSRGFLYASRLENYNRQSKLVTGKSVTYHQWECRSSTRYMGISCFWISTLKNVPAVNVQPCGMFVNLIPSLPKRLLKSPGWLNWQPGLECFLGL